MFVLDKNVNAAAANTPDRDLSLSTYVSLMLYARTRLPKVEWIISNIGLEFLSPKELGLDLIPFFFTWFFFGLVANKFLPLLMCDLNWQGIPG